MWILSQSMEIDAVHTRRAIPVGQKPPRSARATPALTLVTKTRSESWNVECRPLNFKIVFFPSFGLNLPSSERVLITTRPICQSQMSVTRLQNHQDRNSYDQRAEARTVLKNEYDLRAVSRNRALQLRARVWKLHLRPKSRGPFCPEFRNPFTELNTRWFQVTQRDTEW